MIRQGGRSVADESTAANLLHRDPESIDVGALEGFLSVHESTTAGREYGSGGGGNGSRLVIFEKGLLKDERHQVRSLGPGDEEGLPTQARVTNLQQSAAVLHGAEPLRVRHGYNSLRYFVGYVWLQFDAAMHGIGDKLVELCRR
jgi:hypothetical protein